MSWSVNGRFVCRKHLEQESLVAPDAGATGALPASTATSPSRRGRRRASSPVPSTIGELPLLDAVDVVESLEKLAAQANRVVEFWRRRIEDVSADDFARLNAYQTHYNAALDRAAKIVEHFGRYGLDKYRLEEQARLSRAVAELVVVLIGTFVDPGLQTKAREFARMRLTAIPADSAEVAKAS